jgi:hypothetical protein
MDVDTLHEIASQHIQVIDEVLQQSGPSIVKIDEATPKPSPNPTSGLITETSNNIFTSNFADTSLLPSNTVFIQRKTIPTQGKNITQMKAIYGKKTQKKSRKRKTPQQNEVNETTPPTVIVGPGRPTKNDGLLRDAQNEDNATDDEAIYAFREVHLLTSNGTIRKRTKLLTKQSDRDLRCFAIKHFASL